MTSNKLPEIPELKADHSADTKLTVAEIGDAVVKPEVVIDIEAESKAAELEAKNWNPLANAMADAQGIEVGSWHWMLGGNAAWSGSSGSQACYGWRHTHKLTPHYIRTVLANYGHRRSYYQHAPFRQFGYASAGRPHGWEPESSGDMPDGTTTYMTSTGPVTVSGPDAEHLWLTPLFALIDDPSPILVETGMGNRLPSNLVAKWLATMLVSSAVGMVRDQNGGGTQPYPWTYGDRATGRLLHTIMEGQKRGCLMAVDVSTAAFFIRDIVLAFYEKTPGIHSFGAPREGRFPMGLFNGLDWIIPACYDTANQLATIPGLQGWSDRYMALVSRWSQWMIDMNDTLPLECFKAGILYVDPAFTQGTEPVASIKELIRPEDFDFSFDFFPWAFRAVDIAATVTNNAGLIASRDAIINQYGSDPGKRNWMVGADGEYVS
jgi:hypothetical protein